MSYWQYVLIGFFLGALGGLTSHANWLIDSGRKAIENNRSLSAAKRAVKARVGLMVLAIAGGSMPGFVIAIFAYDNRWKIGAFVVAAFSVGLLGSAAIRKLLPVLS